MAANLRKYKFEASSSTKPSAASVKSLSDPAPSAPAPASQATKAPKASSSIMDPETIKADILASLRQDFSAIIKGEMREALRDNFESLKTQIEDVKTEIKNNTAALRAEVDQVKANVRSVEDHMSTMSDEMIQAQGQVSDLQAEVKRLKEKCEDMEGRMRRGNIRVSGVSEAQGSSTPEAVSSLLKEVFRLDREVRVERSHRIGPVRNAGDRPRVIIARLNSEGDAEDILRRARSGGGQLRYRGSPIAVFPDYTTNVVQARAAFTEVRRMLRDKPGVRYGILFPARLRVTHNNVEKEFVDATKAMDYVKKIILFPREDGEQRLN
ncbi:unnamed protein product [Knipowitschia caucasica]|uniref:L1 transposable element RRM domain-containing protein n=1 Tax=Knipowitschia caucasica TaxID=637954 RepID=A0AAV2M9H4_KNICA